MSSEDEDMDGDTPSDKASLTLPPMSQGKYNQAYQQFQKWNKLNGWCPVSEDHLMKYFTELAVKSKPSTLFALYSMLKATFRINDSIDIGKYTKLLEYLKEKNVGYKPVRSKVFTEDEIERFIKEAPDDRWLDVKVVCIFGVSGAYSTKKLLNVMVQNVKQYDDMILVTIPRTETTPQGTFTITGAFFSTVQKYADLRPKDVSTHRFLLNYHDEKCTAQPIGKNKLYGMPRRMAIYLKLPEPERYSGISFRRNSPNLYGGSNAWNPTPIVDEPTERVELDYQTGHLKTSSFNYPRPPLPTFTAPRIATTNGNKTDTGTGHICTLSCGQVKCASEENEGSVLHAFAALKPSEYVITDVTPAVYPSEPACRWIVAYTHSMDAVTAYNADETFDEITRSIPNNVRINQKYIRGNSSQSMAAYVVVYGVTCKCHKDTTDIFSFSVNDVKCEV